MAEISIQSFSICPARSFADFMYLRQLRNSVRSSMTNNPGKIGIVEQARFYFLTPRNITIYIARQGEKRVGYVLLRSEGPLTFITEAVDPGSRRVGVGRKLIEFAKQFKTDLIADILLANEASIRLHCSAGFAYVRDDGRVATYQFTH